MLYVFEFRRGTIFHFEKMTVKEFEKAYRLDMPYDEWVAADRHFDDVFETSNLKEAKEFFADNDTVNENLAEEIRKELGA